MRRTMPPQPVPLSSTPCWAMIPDSLKKSRGLRGDELAIQLTRGFWAMISPEDSWLAEFCWQAMVSGKRLVYAARTSPHSNGKKVLEFMHAVIINQPDMESDHRDQHILTPFRLIDNRRDNLRAVTKCENHANMRKSFGKSSKFKGVRWDKKNRNWRARIVKNYVATNLGSFSTQEAAAEAYNAAHARLFPNIPEGRNSL